MCVKKTSRELVLHKITLNNKENNEKTYYFNQKKFSFIFTLRIYIGHCYKYKINSTYTKYTMKEGLRIEGRSFHFFLFFSHFVLL